MFCLGVKKAHFSTVDYLSRREPGEPVRGLRSVGAHRFPHIKVKQEVTEL